jgi:beta-galactosidase
VSSAAGLVLSTLPEDVEVVRRQSASGSYLIVINHGQSDAVVPGDGVELLTGDPVAGRLPVPAGSVRVLRCGS